MVTSRYGVTVEWNSVHNVRLTVLGRYLNKTVGLCGTYNGNKDDDLWTSYGLTVVDPVDFGNSWKVDRNCENATKVANPCDENPGRKLIAQANCSVLLSAPFNSCSSFINASAEHYISDCEYDICSCRGNDPTCYCQALEAYADDCASFVDIQWENNSEFAVCGRCLHCLTAYVVYT